MTKKIEIIALIYRSVAYLQFIVDQLRSDACKAEGWDVGFRIVANDATPEVLQALKDLQVVHTTYYDAKPDDYYLNRVYRAWNFAGKTTAYPHFVFVNSDSAFGPKWLENLLKHYDEHTLPCSMFFESGKMASGYPGMTKNFGMHPREFRKQEWEKFASKWVTDHEDETVEGGMYMPYPISREFFSATGGYPEGNLYHNGVGTLGHFVMSGDKYYFERLKNEFGMQHFTAMDSVFYHIQEGEKDE